LSNTSLSDSVYEAILERIVFCHYPPGSLINEEQLVHELNASRTPIRSALIRLQEEKLVRIIPKKGIQIRDITPNGVRNLYNLRDLIETYAIENFGHRFPKDRLMDYLAFFSKDDPQMQLQIFYIDVDFHTEIVKQTGNDILRSYYQNLQHHLTRLSYYSGKNIHGRLPDSNQEHRKIIMALLRDDIEAASQALTAHLKRSREIAYQSILDIPPLP